jgi:multicomponent K+:H+ antiporter subunit A
LLPVAPVIAVGWLMLIVATVSVVTMHHHRFRALVLIGIIGLSISAGFAYLSAPDLALTQISVETVTIMLLLLALHFMPKSRRRRAPMGLKLRDAAIALGCGRRGRRRWPTRS